MPFYLPISGNSLQHSIRQYLFKDMLFDFSHQMISDSQLDCLVARANTQDIKGAISALENGHYTNTTEQRAVLHHFLRNSAGSNVHSKIIRVLDQIEALCEHLHTSQLISSTNKSINQIVCIGVGGSDLGPRLVIESLYHVRNHNLNINHVSNLDSTDLKETLDRIDVERTLFVIASKTFTTKETVVNFDSIKKWATTRLNVSEDIFLASQVVAITANPDQAKKVGIPDQNIYEFWEWVGGRFSLWSAVGLPIALSLGMPAFRELLRGAADMDQHFFESPLNNNIPVLMALIGIWNIEQFDAVGLSIAPYSHRLRSLSKYLQQLEMESNGKRHRKDGTFVSYHTAPIVFGDAGTNGQHAYFQMLHQGTRHIPTDFIAVVKDVEDFDNHHDQLLANCFAQSEALAEGKIDKDQPYKSCSGGQRSTTILMPELSPYYLGALLAAYEHKVFVQGVMWGVNSFDQWGVELGKKIAQDIYKGMLDPLKRGDLHPVTRNLIEHVEKIRAKFKNSSDN